MAGRWVGTALVAAAALAAGHFAGEHGWVAAARAQAPGGGAAPDGANGEGAPPAPSWKGPVFEYKVQLVQFADFADTPEYKALREQWKDDWRASYAFHERGLTRLGAEGWELVHLGIPNEKVPSTIVLYLKRSVPR
jgi:hypothetical protein